MDRQGRGLCDEPPTPGWGPLSAWLLWLFLSAFAIFFAKFYVFPKIKLNIFNQEMDAMNVNSPYGLLNFLLGARGLLVVTKSQALRILHGGNFC